MTSALFMFAIHMGCAKQKLKNMEPPTPQEIFDRYEQVTTSDGMDDWENIYFAGKMEMPLMNVSFPLESWTIKGEGTLTTYEIPNVGLGGQGYDLQNAWSLDPVKGDRLMEGKEKESVIHEYQSLLVDSYNELYKDSKVVKMDTMEGENVWVLTAVGKFNNSPTKMFFSIETGLLVAEYKEIPSGKGSINGKMYIEEYSVIEGTEALAPKKIRLKAMGMTQYMIFDVLQVNAPNPPKIEPPPSILEFLEQEDPNQEEDIKQSDSPENPNSPKEEGDSEGENVSSESEEKKEITVPEEGTE